MCALALPASAGFVYEGGCLESRADLATLQCRDLFPVYSEGGAVVCLFSTNPDGQMYIETQNAAGAVVSGGYRYALAPTCTPGDRSFLDGIRWGNAAHAAQALFALLLFALFAHGYGVGARE